MTRGDFPDGAIADGFSLGLWNSSESKTNFAVKAKHFEAAIAVDSFDLLAAAVNGKVVDLVGFDAVHILENVGLHAAKAGPIVINLALPRIVVKVDAPAIFPHHAEVQP